MKRAGHIYEKVCDLGNIRLAIESAARHKRGRRNVQRILSRKEQAAREIHILLTNKTFIPSDYTIRNIRDCSSGKHRTIHVPKFYPDQIVHWALMLQLKPMIMRGMYAHSCGSVPGRGQAHGQRYLRRWLDNDQKNTKYCLKMDVSKFYQSVNHDLLMDYFRRVVKDPDALGLIELIINSTGPGLPIGNYTSQWFANFFLQELDHYIKQSLGAKYYIRYVDDMVILGPNKKKLHSMRRLIENFLGQVKLSLKDDWQVFPVRARPIDFLGFKFYRGHTTLRARNALRIRRRVRLVKRKLSINRKDACAIISYLGMVSRCDCLGYRKRHIDGMVSIKRMKGIIRNESRKQISSQCNHA